eukprot:3805031-Prymnesium_polylepis.2
MQEKYYGEGFYDEMLLTEATDPAAIWNVELLPWPDHVTEIATEKLVRPMQGRTRGQQVEQNRPECTPPGVRVWSECTRPSRSRSRANQLRCLPPRRCAQPGSDAEARLLGSLRQPPRLL